MTSPRAADQPETLPDDVVKEVQRLGGVHMQVEVYPAHELVVLRFRRKLDIRTSVVVLPFQMIDAVFSSRLQVLMAKNQGGTVVPATGPTPAPDSGSTVLQ